MIRAKFSPRAQSDLEEICSFIASRSPDAAERVRATFLNTADVLAANREIGRRILRAGPRHADIRWLVVPEFRNYLIFYRPVEDTIIVVRVLHAARDWKRFFPVSQEPPR